MRAALVISLVLAVVAAIFAIQNPGNTNVNIGPYEVYASTALLIIITFGLGVVVGILASLPSRIRHRREVRRLEHRIAEERTEAPATSTRERPVAPPADVAPPPETRPTTTERVEREERRSTDL